MHECVIDLSPHITFKSGSNDVCTLLSPDHIIPDEVIYTDMGETLIYGLSFACSYNDNVISSFL